MAEISGAAPGAVSAHVRFGSVGIEYAHPDINTRRLFQKQHAVSAGAVSPVADILSQPCQGSVGQTKIAGRIVHDRKIVACGHHLCKINQMNQRGT
jgi:hypothetical protein